jgi:cell division protein FtsQ
VRAPAAALGRRALPGHLLRRAFRMPKASAKVKRRLLAAVLLAAALGAAYLLWFRDSSFVRVERVIVTGLGGSDAPRERAALIATATGMSTLHVDEAALRDALGAGAAVEAIEVTTDFPHGMRIRVVEKAPVAVLAYGNERVAVGSGGVLLPDVEPLPRDLPAIEVGALPSGMRLGDGRARRLVAAAAAAPRQLLGRVDRIRELPGKGLVAFLSDGPQVILGSATDLATKWAAAAAILADDTSSGAAYVDVRLPDRPVAGGLDLPPPAPDEQPGAADAPAPVPGETAAGATPGAPTTTTTPSSSTAATPSSATPTTSASAGP